MKSSKHMANKERKVFNAAKAPRAPIVKPTRLVIKPALAKPRKLTPGCYEARCMAVTYNGKTNVCTIYIKVHK